MMLQHHLVSAPCHRRPVLAGSAHGIPAGCTIFDKNWNKDSGLNSGKTKEDGRDVESVVDLDVLRGWRESRDPRLRQSHEIPVLAELVQLSDSDRPLYHYGVYGTDVLLGRFQSQYAPVDLHFPHLEDHQLYRLGAPHAHLSFDEDGWQIQAISPASDTLVNQQVLRDLHVSHYLTDGDIVTLGAARFRFHPSKMPIAHWQEERARLLSQVNEPALFLKRQGCVCGPFCRLSQDSPVILGRSFPEPGVLPGTGSWPKPDAMRWDLSGLYDFERRYVGFRHASIGLRKGRWMIEPLSNRQRTFVNRIAISGAIALESGDEIALGSVLFRFHHPHRTIDSSRPRHVPAVLDWSEGKPPKAPKSEQG